MRRILFLLLSLCFCATSWGQDYLTYGKADSRYANLFYARTGGYSIVSDHGAKGSNLTETAVATTTTGQFEVRPPFAITMLRLVFGDWYNGTNGENAIGNSVLWGASFNYQGASVNDSINNIGQEFSFGGLQKAWCQPGETLFTDPLPVNEGANALNWVKCSASTPIPAAPSAPALTASSTSIIASGTYYVGIAYHYPGLGFSLLSTLTSITITTHQGISVTSPSAVAGSDGYGVFMTNVNTTYAYDTFTGVVPYGTAALVQYWNNNGLTYAARCSQVAYAPFGVIVQGGTAAGSANNGEGYITGTDAAHPGVAVNSASGAAMPSPVMMLGLAADGKVHPSIGVMGDSRMEGHMDTAAYATSEGLGPVARFAAGQTNLSSCAYNVSSPNLYPFVTIAQSSETLAIVNSSQFKNRSGLVSWATHVIDDLGINDCGAGAAPMLANAIPIAVKQCNYGQYYYHTTLDPHTSSTDGWATTTNQTFATNEDEADRRQFNNCLVDTSATTLAVTGDVPFRVASSAYGPSGTPYSGGDAATTIYIAKYPMLESSFTNTVNGSAAAYTFLYPATINGQTYASGVTFTSAPASGATVLFNYTKPVGFQSLVNSLALFPTCRTTIQWWNAGTEVNSSGTVAYDGGFWAPWAGTVATGQTVTSTTVAVLTNTAWSYTQDQLRNTGACVIITADTGTPASVGQSRGIGYNTATQIYVPVSFTTQPSTSAVFTIAYSLTPDGLHGSTFASIKEAQYLQTFLGALSYP
jgi:hypothetical protein